MNRKNRIILLSNYESIDVKDSKAVLELCGYSVATWFDLHQPYYAHNQKMMVPRTQAHQNLMLELVEDALLVIHPDTKPERVLEIARHTRFIGKKMVPLSAVDSDPDKMTEERIDATNIAGAYVAMATTSKCVVPLSEVFQPIERATTSPLVNGGRNTYRKQSGTTLGKRALRERLRALQIRVLHWEQRLNAYFGQSLKNPMVREQQQPAYYKHQVPLSTTG